jgi:hypothetical protein
MLGEASTIVFNMSAVINVSADTIFNEPIYAIYYKIIH